MEIKQWRMLTGQSICVLLLLLVFCVIFSKEMPIDSISKVQAQEAKESVLSESTRTRAQKLSDPKQDDASKKSQYVIVLDAGHGGKDEGAVSDDGKLEEKEYNLNNRHRKYTVRQDRNAQYQLMQGDCHIWRVSCIGSRNGDLP